MFIKKNEIMFLLTILLSQKYNNRLIFFLTYKFNDFFFEQVKINYIKINKESLFALGVPEGGF
jgi:hypothetical protein